MTTVAVSHPPLPLERRCTSEHPSPDLLARSPTNHAYTHRDVPGAQCPSVSSQRCIVPPRSDHIMS
eukprot:1262913-Prymnesium_polylepis.1